MKTYMTTGKAKGTPFAIIGVGKIVILSCRGYNYILNPAGSSGDCGPRLSDTSYRRKKENPALEELEVIRPCW